MNAITNPKQHFADKAASVKTEPSFNTINPLAEENDNVVDFTTPEQNSNDPGTLDSFLNDDGSFDLDSFLGVQEETKNSGTSETGGTEVDPFAPMETDNGNQPDDRMDKLLESIGLLVKGQAAMASTGDQGPSLQDRLVEKFGNLTDEDRQEYADVIPVIRKLLPEAVLESNTLFSSMQEEIKDLKSQLAQYKDTKPAGVDSVDIFKANLPTVIPMYDKVVNSKLFNEKLDKPASRHDDRSLRTLWDEWHNNGRTDRIAAVVAEYLSEYTGKKQALNNQVVVQGTASSAPVDTNSPTMSNNNITKVEAIFNRMASDREFRRSISSEQLQRLRRMVSSSQNS